MDLFASSNVTAGAGDMRHLNMSDDVYDYLMYLDYMSEVDPSHIPARQLVPVALAYGLTFVLGLLGNVLVIFAILRYRRMQSVTNVFLLSLSLADLLVIVVCVPVKVRTAGALSTNCTPVKVRTVDALSANCTPVN